MFLSGITQQISSENRRRFQHIYLQRHMPIEYPHTNCKLSTSESVLSRKKKSYENSPKTMYKQAKSSKLAIQFWRQLPQLVKKAFDPVNSLNFLRNHIYHV